MDGIDFIVGHNTRKCPTCQVSMDYLETDGPMTMLQCPNCGHLLVGY